MRRGAIGTYRAPFADVILGTDGVLVALLCRRRPRSDGANADVVADDRLQRAAHHLLAVDGAELSAGVALRRRTVAPFAYEPPAIATLAPSLTASLRSILIVYSIIIQLKLYIDLISI